MSQILFLVLSFDILLHPQFGSNLGEIMKKLSLSIALALTALGASGVSSAVTMEELAAKLDALALENAELKQRVSIASSVYY